MTDDLAAPTVAPEPALQPTPVTGTDRRSPLLIAVAVLGLIVLVGGFLLWRDSTTAGTQAAQLRDRLDALDGRIAKLEARPAPPDLRPLEQRVAAVEARPSLEPRVAALEGRAPPDLKPLEQRLATLEQKPPPEATLDAAGQRQVAELSGRMDGITARQAQLGTQGQADVAKLSDQINGLQQKVAAAVAAGGTVAAQADKATSDVAAVATRETRTARLQAAAVALANGKPLGDIPGAPPALAQFAGKAPPTEAALRLSFDAAAQAAHAAGQPAKETTPLLDRMWDRVQSGVTVRQGDRVIVGDVVTGVLEHSRHLLDAGDLPGAVGVLDGLAGPAAAAMAPWRAQAQSLLDARAALLTVAHG